MQPESNTASKDPRAARSMGLERNNPQWPAANDAMERTLQRHRSAADRRRLIDDEQEPERWDGMS